MISDFHKLEIWKRSRELVVEICKIMSSFPSEEKFGLISQMRRAAVSVPSNIAEGAARKSNKDFRRFLIISLGSCYEVETQLLLSSDLDFIDVKELNKLNNTLLQIIKMMSKFITTLKI